LQLHFPKPKAFSNNSFFPGKKISIGLLIISLVWLVIGLSATIHISIYEDFGLLITTVLVFILFTIWNKKLKMAEAVYTLSE